MEKCNFAKTCIGSVPYTNARDIVPSIIETFKEIPFWPQLSKGSFLENMYVQYSEGFPGIVIDENAKKVFVDIKDKLYSELEGVLQEFLDDNVDAFPIKADYASGFYKFLKFKEEIRDGNTLKFVKGHITGAISFGLTVKDTEGRSILYSRDLVELLPKFLGMKARWQIRKLKEIHDKVIIFVDEPYITSIGSSYVNMDKDTVRNSINEIASLIKREGALCGLHCCGNTEWDFLLKSDIDILSFDAYSFMKEFLLYTDDIRKFLEKSKIIAWGIVPTSAEDLEKITADSLVERMCSAIKQLNVKGIEDEAIFSSSLVTPSCGCGTLQVNECEKIFDILNTVSESLKSKYSI